MNIISNAAIILLHTTYNNINLYTTDSMGLHESHWSPLVSPGLCWSLLVSPGLWWSSLVSAGLRWETKRESRRPVETNEYQLRLQEISGD